MAHNDFLCQVEPNAMQIFSVTVKLYKPKIGNKATCVKQKLLGVPENGLRSRLARSDLAVSFESYPEKPGTPASTL